MLGAFRLGLTDQEGEDASWRNEPGGHRESGAEALDRAESDDGSLAWKIFRASGEYIDIHQCKCADHFAQERGFLLVGFNERDMQIRSPDFDGEAGEAGAGAKVDEVASPRPPMLGQNGILIRRAGRGLAGAEPRPHTGREEAAGGKQGFAEVASDNFFGGADGGEVDARIPAEKYIDVRRYTL